MTMSSFDLLDRNNIRQSLALYFVIGSPQCGDRDPAEVVRQAIAGGVTMVQYREKGQGALEGKQKYELGKRLRDICANARIPFIVNDDLSLAIELEADGLHVGQEDEHLTDARSLIGPNRWLGISVHHPEEALKAVEYGADYAGVGPVYFTSTKQDIREVGGSELVSGIRQTCPELPIVAIGGITAQGIEPIIKAGADGIAVISAIAGNQSPKQAAEQLKQTVHSFIRK